MDYRIMWLYLKEVIKNSEMMDVIIESVLNKMETTEQKEKDGELISFEIEERVKWVHKFLEEDNNEEAIRVLKGVIELKTKQCEAKKQITRRDDF